MTAGSLAEPPSRRSRSRISVTGDGTQLRLPAVQPPRGGVSRVPRPGSRSLRALGSRRTTEAAGSSSAARVRGGRRVCVPSSRDSRRARFAPGQRPAPGGLRAQVHQARHESPRVHRRHRARNRCLQHLEVRHARGRHPSEPDDDPLPHAAAPSRGMRRRFRRGRRSIRSRFPRRTSATTSSRPSSSTT